MAEREKFEIELEGGCVHGSFEMPASASPPVSAAIICRGVHLAGAQAESLLDDLAAALSASGLAVARYEPRCAELILDDFHAHSLAHEVADAMAAFQWLFARSEVNAARISVVGYSLGAIAAGMLAKRVDSIERLCLLAPVTPEHLVARLTKSNGTANGGFIPADGKMTGGATVIDREELPAALLPGLVDVDLPRDVAFHERPTLIAHGAADRFVPPEIALEFQEALEQARRPVEHLLVARADHTFSNPTARAACLEHIARFLSAVRAKRPAAALQTG